MSLLSDLSANVLQSTQFSGEYVAVNNLTTNNLNANAATIEQLFVTDVHVSGEIKFEENDVRVSCNGNPGNILLGNMTAPTGLQNIAIGLQITTEIGTGAANIAIGTDIRTDLVDQKATNYNVAIGYQAALEHTTNNDNNICIGSSAGVVDMGANCIVLGRNALNDSAAGNVVAIGFQAIQNVSGGTSNVVVGTNAGNNNSLGDNNVLLGYSSGQQGNKSNVVAIGTNVFAPEDKCIAIGRQNSIGQGKYNNIVLGHAQGAGAASSLIPLLPLATATDEDAFAAGVPYGGLYSFTDAGKTTLCICLWP